MVCTQFEIRVPYMRIGRGTVRTPASFDVPGTETIHVVPRPGAVYAV